MEARMTPLTDALRHPCPTCRMPPEVECHDVPGGAHEMRLLLVRVAAPGRQAKAEARRAITEAGVRHRKARLAAGEAYRSALDPVRQAHDAACDAWRGVPREERKARHVELRAVIQETGQAHTAVWLRAKPAYATALIDANRAYDDVVCAVEQAYWSRRST